MKNQATETATGGMMIGTISSEVKTPRPRMVCASSSASPNPSSTSMVVTIATHFR